MGGSLQFDTAGNLIITTGDNKAAGGYFQPAAQETSGNTNDLRGKVLRIRPTAAGGYTIPAGNLFAGDETRRPEIYAMGFRNPFRLNIDPLTGYLYVGDIGPDASADSAEGPGGLDEINEIREAAEMGVISGVTTNPTLLAKGGHGDVKSVIQEICKLVPDGPVSMECVTETAAEMIAEGREYAKWGENVYIKVPFCVEGVKAVKQFTSDGIRTNVTLVFSTNQALLAASAGASLGSACATWSPFSLPSPPLSTTMTRMTAAMTKTPMTPTRAMRSRLLTAG